VTEFSILSQKCPIIAIPECQYRVNCILYRKRRIRDLNDLSLHLQEFGAAVLVYY